jgi:hypothetical protein
VIDTVKGESSGVIVNRNATLRVRQSTFIGTKDRSKEVRPTKIGVLVSTVPFNASISLVSDDTWQGMAYVIVNIDGTLEMTGNCFAMNNVTLAPVMSEGGAVEASINSGNGDVLFAAECEFIAHYDEKDETVVIAKISNWRTEVSCINFDTDESCYVVDVEKWMSSPGKADWEVDLPFVEVTLMESASSIMHCVFAGLLSCAVTFASF